MRVHAIQTGSVALERSDDRQPRTAAQSRIIEAWRTPLPVFAWVIEHPEGPIVVDAGQRTGVAPLPPTERRLQPKWRLRFLVEPEQELAAQLPNFGVRPSDIQQIVLTHLHRDHASGAARFPHAEILVLREEWETAAGDPERDVRRFWEAPTPRCRPMDLRPEPIGPWTRSAPLSAAGDVLIVPTPGHTPGHAAVLCKTPASHWLVFAGDSVYSQPFLQDDLLAAAAHDPAEARTTLRQLRAFCESNPSILLPAHDADGPRRLRDGELYPSESRGATPHTAKSADG